MRKGLVLGVSAAAIALLASYHPTADLRFVTHDARDLAPRQVKAAFDVGLVGVSVLYTWSEHVAR